MFKNLFLIFSFLGLMGTAQGKVPDCSSSDYAKNTWNLIVNAHDASDKYGMLSTFKALNENGFFVGFFGPVDKDDLTVYLTVGFKPWPGLTSAKEQEIKVKILTFLSKIPGNELSCVPNRILM